MRKSEREREREREAERDQNLKGCRLKVVTDMPTRFIRDFDSLAYPTGPEISEELNFPDFLISILVLLQ